MDFSTLDLVLSNSYSGDSRGFPDAMQPKLLWKMSAFSTLPTLRHPRNFAKMGFPSWKIWIIPICRPSLNERLFFFHSKNTNTKLVSQVCCQVGKVCFLCRTILARTAAEREVRAENFEIHTQNEFTLSIFQPRQSYHLGLYCQGKFLLPPL